MKYLGLLGVCLCMPLFFTGCTPKAAKPVDNGPVLKRVEYDCSQPSVYGADMTVDLTPEKIVNAHFYGQGFKKTEIKDKKMNAKYWAMLEEAIKDMEDKLTPKPTETEPVTTEEEPMEEIYELDGAATYHLWLTWEKDGVEERIEYYNPTDHKWITVEDIIDEILEPIGREITRFEDPIVTGVLLYKQSDTYEERYSYQCTLEDKETGRHYLFVHTPETNISDYATKKQWEKLNTLLEELNIEQLPKGSLKDEICVQLYKSDGYQYGYIPDEETITKIIACFEEIIKNK